MRVVRVTENAYVLCEIAHKIDNAQKTLDLCTYLFEPRGFTARLIVLAIKRAVGRGVHVRLL